MIADHLIQLRTPGRLVTKGSFVDTAFTPKSKVFEDSIRVRDKVSPTDELSDTDLITLPPKPVRTWS
jgi:hypothetical protein